MTSYLAVVWLRGRLKVHYYYLVDSEFVVKLPTLPRDTSTIMLCHTKDSDTKRVCG